MIKKCKQCGRELTPDESNNMCKACREKKKAQRTEVRNDIIDQKKRKVWKKK